MASVNPWSDYLGISRGFPRGFRFWFDVLAVLSLLLDVGWVTDPHGGETDNIFFWNGSSSGFLGTSSSPVVVADIYRIVRNVRTVALSQRLYEVVDAWRQKSLNASRQHDVVPIHTIDTGNARLSSQYIGTGTSAHFADLKGSSLSEDSHSSSGGFHDRGSGFSPSRTPQSQIGRRLAGNVTQQMMLIVISMTLCLAFFVVVVSSDDPLVDGSIVGGLRMLHRMPQDLNVTTRAFRGFVVDFFDAHSNAIKLEVCTTGCLHVWNATTIATWLEPNVTLDDNVLQSELSTINLINTYGAGKLSESLLWRRVQRSQCAVLMVLGCVTMSE